MRIQTLCICILTFLEACNSKIKIQQHSNCFVKYDSLFKIVDTSTLEIHRNTDSAAIEVLDKNMGDGERGLLRFDKNGNLRLYAFLYNNHSDTRFLLIYDSVGNHRRSSDAEVIQWNFYDTKDSTIKFTFFLCAIDRNYGDIKIESGKFKKANIELFKSEFVKLNGATMTINRSDFDESGKIYITGTRQDKCSKLKENFIDSIVLPYDSLKSSVQH